VRRVVVAESVDRAISPREGIHWWQRSSIPLFFQALLAFCIADVPLHSIEANRNAELTSTEESPRELVCQS
jgi:hypothetical protein